MPAYSDVTWKTEGFQDGYMIVLMDCSGISVLRNHVTVSLHIIRNLNIRGNSYISIDLCVCVSPCRYAMTVISISLLPLCYFSSEVIHQINVFSCDFPSIFEQKEAVLRKITGKIPEEYNTRLLVWPRMTKVLRMANHWFQKKVKCTVLK